MNVTKLVLPTSALGLAAVLLVPTQSDAFAVIGTSLSTSQRHFKIFDNFTDAQANNNTTPDTNFPGYTGAEMAIWKAGVEWGSRLHGNGNGDPQQPGGLGSGGANFDFYYMGKATAVGNIGDNICSEIAGSNGGVLAFTEYLLPPNFNGWRMRFYAGWTWADGPTTGIPGSEIDIQGVACHELGHALGLDHTGVSGSTMLPAITGTGTTQRSIEADDIAGLQAIYGVASATKPIISALAPALGQVTITGANFTATNQVWFTQSATSMATSVIVSGAVSGGSSITVLLPANAGPGDILVKTSGSGGASLSNAFPFTPGTNPICPSPYNYCLTNPNSFDANGAFMDWLGTQFISQNNFAVSASGVPPGSAGIFFYGSAQTAVPFGNGWFCATGSIVRLPVVITNFAGVAFYQLDQTQPPVLGTIIPGGTQNFQFWFRDVPGGGSLFNLSDGLSVQFCP